MYKINESAMWLPYCFIMANRDLCVADHRQVILENVPDSVTEQMLRVLSPEAINIIVGNEMPTKGYVHS